MHECILPNNKIIHLELWLKMQNYGHKENVSYTTTAHKVAFIYQMCGSEMLDFWLCILRCQDIYLWVFSSSSKVLETDKLAALCLSLPIAGCQVS